MKIKRLDQAEVKRLYETSMQEDFPQSELRPYSSIRSLMESGEYLCFGCMDEKKLCAYALFAVTQGAALLDYYAVDSSLRGQGVGQKFLTGLKEFSSEFQASRILLEVESVSSAETEEETALRERRIRFYEHCGCTMTGVCSWLFGVEYQVMCLPFSGEVPSDPEIKRELEQLYRLIVTPLASGEDAYRKVCRVSLGRP